MCGITRRKCSRKVWNVRRKSEKLDLFRASFSLSPLHQHVGSSPQRSHHHVTHAVHITSNSGRKTPHVCAFGNRNIWHHYPLCHARQLSLLEIISYSRTSECQYDMQLDLRIEACMIRVHRYHPYTPIELHFQRGFLRNYYLRQIKFILNANIIFTRSEHYLD